MAKYKRKAKVYQVKIEDGEHAGFEMLVRSVKLGKFVKLARLAASFDLEELKTKEASTKEASEVFDGMTELFESFGHALISWNLQEPVEEDKDEETDEWRDVPATGEGVMEQEFEFVMFLIGEWIGAMGGIPDPLAPKPASGANSNDADSPEKTLASASRPLSNEPS